MYCDVLMNTKYSFFSKFNDFGKVVNGQFMPNLKDVNATSEGCQIICFLIINCKNKTRLKCLEKIQFVTEVIY